MKIKSIIYTLLMVMSSLLFVTCSEEDILSQNGNNIDDNKVHLRIGLTLPEAQSTQTRAFNRTDFEFENLHVAVFVKQGNVYILEEFVRAESPAPEWHETPNESCTGSNHWDFGVTLSKTDEPRRLHFIANYPGLTMGLGEEGSLIGRLTADPDIDSGQHDVYWNFLDVDCIQAGTQGELSDIPLIRNFTKVELKVEQKSGVNLNKKFLLLGYAMHNVPKRGTVAPYNSANGTFANYIDNTDNSLSCQSYDNLEQTQGYVGNEPYDNEFTFLTDFRDKDVPFYMYERTHVNVDEPTCMIIKGKYRTDEETSFEETDASYYKLDFIHHDSGTNTNVYYNMLRNFIYTMKIVDVTGEGYSTPEEAIANPASNNISGNANIDDFTNISDGTGRLFVSTTYLVFTDAEPIDIYYKYIPNVNTPDVIKNDLKGVNDGEIIVTARQDLNKVLHQDGVVASADETTGRVGWRKVTLTPNPPPSTNEDYVRTQDITIASNHLQRKITLVMRNPYEMSVNLINSHVPAVVKSPVDLKVTIPGGIPSSLFPLKFYVSSEKNSVYAKPGGDMYSESYAGGYGFVKEITWDFYSSANSTGTNDIGESVGIKESDGRISFICNLVTNCEQSATEVYVDNEYFNRGSDSFDNRDITNVLMTTGTGVKIQQSSGRYPQRIHSNGIIDDVEVFLNGEDTGKTITINSNKVLQGVTFENYSDAGLDLTQELTFKFSDRYYMGSDNWSTDAVEYVATCTLRDIRDGKPLNFKAPAIRIYEITIPETQEVSVQQTSYNSGWQTSYYYPRAINNGNSETVTIKLNGNVLNNSTITINRDNVTRGVILRPDGGFSPTDVLTFTFEDRYCTGSNIWGELSWSSQTTTWTATCTVEELLNGTTLDFKHNL